MRGVAPAAALAAILVVAGCGGKSVSDVVSSYKGESAVCDRVGVIMLAGKQEKLYGCREAPDAPSSFTMCAVYTGGELYDVTKTARLVFAAQGVNDQPC